MSKIVLHIAPSQECARQEFIAQSVRSPENINNLTRMQATDPDGIIHWYTALQNPQKFKGMEFLRIESVHDDLIPDWLLARVR
jgi:hypothetical protein